MPSQDSMPAEAVRIPLRRRDGSVRAYTIVDAADAEWASQWHWSLRARSHSDDGYTARGTLRDGVQKTYYLHRELMGCTAGDGLEVDHINRDKLDNRRSNLRMVTRSGNSQNTGARTNTTSKYRGVYFQRTQNRWVAQIKVNRRTVHVGSFLTEDEAGKAAKAARQAAYPYAHD